MKHRTLISIFIWALADNKSLGCYSKFTTMFQL
jgi:hypothetical protein